MKNVCRIALACILLSTSVCIAQVPARSNEYVWPKPPAQARIKFLYSFSGRQDIGTEKSWFRRALDFIFGEEDDVGSFDRPQGITVDSDGRIYVTDTGAKGVHVFDFERKEYKFIEREEGLSFVSPVGVAVAQDGTMYLSDADLHTVFVFDKDGECKTSITNGLKRPTGVWVSGDILYVVDTESNQVIAFDLEGREKSRFGQRGISDREFNFPVYLCAGNTNQRYADNLYVVDALNFRLQTLRKDGRFVSAFGKLGDGVGNFARPKGVALDSDGHIYIADALFDVVQVFDQSGQLLMSFGGSGSGIGNFSLPAGIAIDSHDRIYVVDSGNRRVQVFQYLK